MSVYSIGTLEFEQCRLSENDEDSGTTNEEEYHLLREVGCVFHKVRQNKMRDSRKSSKNYMWFSKAVKQWHTSKTTC